MKKAIVLFVLMLGLSATAQGPRPRFELLLRETVVPEKGETHVVQEFETWHDRETGMEIICARGGYTDGIQGNYSISCFPTGRKWN